MANIRNPEQTRTRLIEAAFSEIHEKGFQGMRVDTVLSKTDLKKGAFYHHFKSKQELGYAVMDTVIQKMVEDAWINPLEVFDDPILGMKTIMADEMKNVSSQFLEYGCPLNNLAQEMSPLDEGFRQRIETLYQRWRESISRAFRRGQDNGFVDPALDIDKVSIFILAALEGSISIGKNSRNMEIFMQCIGGLSDYLDMLSLPD